MEVSATELRANLRYWLDQIRNGGEVVITERGIPVALITGIDATSVIEELTAKGVIGTPLSPQRSRAVGRDLPQAGRSLSDLIAEQRR